MAEEKPWQDVSTSPVPIAQWAEEDGGKLRPYLAYRPGYDPPVVVAAGKPPDGATHWREMPDLPQT